MCLNQTNRTIIIVINEKKTENWIKFLVMLANNIFYVAIPYQCHKYKYISLCMYVPYKNICCIAPPKIISLYIFNSDVLCMVKISYNLLFFCNGG